MLPFFLMPLGIAIIAIFLIRGATEAAETHTIELLYFFTEECDHCRHVDEFVLGPLQDVYPVRVERINIDEDHGYKHLLREEEAAGDRGRTPL
ncbi:hypothetical protein JXL19_02545 [bacterium]|nr:hypothetical protein [bacterium]